jgi:hypothetical protein
MNQPKIDFNNIKKELFKVVGNKGGKIPNAKGGGLLAGLALGAGLLGFGIYNSVYQGTIFIYPN